MLDCNEVVRLGVEAFDHIETSPIWSDGERMAARSAVRGMMVRLGLYTEFTKALQEKVSENAVGHRSDGTPISPYAPDGGPV